MATFAAGDVSPVLGVEPLPFVPFPDVTVTFVPAAVELSTSA